MKNRYLPITLMFSLITLHSLAMDNAHFFRAPFFFGEPRLAEPHLFSFDILAAFGETRKARNDCGKCVPLLDLYGLYNMQLLGSNVPDKDPTVPEDLALIMLDRLAGQDGFGYFSFSGKFKAFEVMLGLTQNFDKGFFMQLWIPIRGIRLTQVCYTDCSPCPCPCPAIDDPNWQLFLALFNDILARYDLSATGFKENGIGDVTLLAGWALNYEGRRSIDYIDFCLRVGILAPSGHKQNLRNAFSIPLGYNGHFGFPVAVECSLGAFDWLTIGGHAEALAFLPKKYTIRYQTDCRQSGMIKLAQSRAHVNMGAVWELGGFIKADHIVKGLSLLVGYIHQAQMRTVVCLDCACGKQAAANCDEMLHGWSMDTMNFELDYDFSKEGHRLGERIGFFYNLQIAGEHVFQTNMGGGSFGLDYVIPF